MKFEMLTTSDDVSMMSKLKVVDFLYDHLDQYGDKKENIMKAIEYALSPYPNAGGFIIYYEENGQIIGAVVINNTGMQGYIPENILVYIAVHKDYRGKGLGKKLMAKTIELTKGDIALHVEKDNPARILYEKVGFKTPYLEMRYYKN